MEETFHTEVGNCESQHGQLVQFGDDIGGEWQEAGQSVKFSVQPVPVSLGWVGFLIGRGRLPDNETQQRGEAEQTLMGACGQTAEKTGTVSPAFFKLF